MAAWIVLLGVIAAGIGYVLLAGDEPQQAEADATPTDASEPLPTVPAATSDAPEPAEKETAESEAAPAEAGATAATPDAPTPAEPEAVGQTVPLQPASQNGASGTAADSGATPAGGARAPEPAAATQQANLPPTGAPAWERFAIPFEKDRPGPRVAVVLSGLGLSAAATEAAIKQLPPAITLSFSPYARLLDQWIALARVNGHEVMLDLPMEPVTFPEDDPGPHALLTVLDREQNLKRLDWLLKRGNSYVGVAAVMGSRFLSSEEHLLPVLEEVKSRGLLFLDNRASEESAADALAEKLSLPYVLNDRTLDATQASRVAIDSRLSEVERLARENGFAVALAQPYPVTIERLRDWTAEVEARGLVLTPISALAQAR